MTTAIAGNPDERQTNSRTLDGKHETSQFEYLLSTVVGPRTNNERSLLEELRTLEENLWRQVLNKFWVQMSKKLWMKHTNLFFYSTKG